MLYLVLPAPAQMGLALLQAEESVFSCHESEWDDMYYSELGASATILRWGHPPEPYAMQPHCASLSALPKEASRKHVLHSTGSLTMPFVLWHCRAGYNLDCLLARYQGVDWRNRDNWNCNSRYELRAHQQHIMLGLRKGIWAVVVAQVHSTGHQPV
jgi:hypothetical protein